MNKYFGMCFIFLFISWSAFAHQEKPYASKPIESLTALKKIYAQSIENGDVLAEGKCLQQMGKVCYRQGHFRQSLEFFLKADKIFNAENQPLLLAANLSDIGILYYYIKQPEKAMKNYLQSLNIYKRHHQLREQAIVYGQIGQLYEKRKQYDSAFYYQHLALKLIKQTHNNSAAAKIYENLGSIYEDLEKYDIALLKTPLT